MRANVFALGCECVCVRALSPDKPQSGATDAASCALLQQERKNKKKKGRKGKIAGEVREPTGLYFLRSARQTKLALGAAPFMKERRWVEHNLPSSSWLGIKEQI